MRTAGPVSALCLLAICAPAIAQTAEENYQAGVAARLAGNLDEALGFLLRAATAEPENADIHLQIGLVRLAMGSLGEAEAAFRRTLELAPDYADARLGVARVAHRRGDRKAALAELDRIGPGNAEADQLRRQIGAAETDRPWRWRVDLDASHTGIDTQPDWQSAALVVQHRWTGRTTLAVTGDATRRFDRNDVYAELRVDHRFAPGAYVHIRAGGTPAADHRPKRQFGAGAAIRTHGGPYATVLRLDVVHADYPQSEVETVTPEIEQYLGGRAWITGQWIHVWDRFNHSSGWLLRGDVMPTDTLRLFAGAANAPDLDAGVVIDTTSLFAGLSVDIGRHLTLRASYAHDDPDAGPDRDTLGLGMGYRF